MSFLKRYVVGGEQVAAKFERMPEQFQSALRQGIGRAVIMVQIRTKEKLNGGVLNVKTGRLRRSINTRVTEEAGRVEGIVGTNVDYAHAHEFGFIGTVSVREHLRRTVNGNQATVRAHSRHMNVPEKSFLRSSLNELQPDIRGEIESRVSAYLKQTTGF